MHNKIKISTNFNWPLERQTPGGEGWWAESEFFVDRQVDEVDFWVVAGGLQQPEKLMCDPANTLFVGTEPPSIKKYDDQFLSQFEYVISSDETIQHRNLFLTQQGLPWMVGASFDPQKKVWGDFWKFEDFKNSFLNKEKVLSVVISRGKSTEGHRQRDKFVKALKKSLGGLVDVYGVGYDPIKDKIDAISQYKYHLVLENSSFSDYWSEKLSDCFLGEALPIYYGCPNICKYFDNDSLIRIDILNIGEAVKQVSSIINSDVYETRRSHILESKQRVLYRYNLFNVLTDFFKNKKVYGSKSVCELQPENFFAYQHPQSRPATILNKFAKWFR